MSAPLLQKRARRRLLLLKREPGRRRDPVRRSAAGEKHQHEIVGVDRVGEFEHALGRRDAGLVGHRMAGLDHRNARGRPPVTVAGDGEPGKPRRGGNAEIVRSADFGHRARRLAGGEDDQPPARRRLRQVRRQAAARMRGGDRAAKQRFEKLVRCAIGSQWVHPRGMKHWE